MSHNTYMSFLVELGLVGFAVYLSMLGCLYISGIRTLRLLHWYPIPGLKGMGIGLVLGITCHLTNMLVTDLELTPYMWVVFGMASAYYNIVRNEVELTWGQQPELQELSFSGDKDVSYAFHS